MKRSMFWYPRLALPGAIALLSASLSGPALATGPDFPGKVVRQAPSGRAALDFTVVADPAAASAIAVSSTLFQHGKQVRKDSSPAVAVQLPGAPASVPVEVSGPHVASDLLPDGVYSRIVHADVTLRGGGAKPASLTEYDYFRISKGQVAPITADEYSEAVQPTYIFKLPNGVSRAVRDGGGVDRGLKQSGRAPEATRID
jgi:hypothetical protein